MDVTVPEAHRDVTVQALAAGLPVLGEKPMASRMAEAREMVAASESAGKLYMVSQSRRYDANLHALRQLILDHVGPLGILNSDFYIGAHFGGFRDEMANVLILDMAIHTFDAARFLCGGDPVAVYCEEFNPPWSWYKGDASRDGDLRDDRRPALHLPRLLVRRGASDTPGRPSGGRSGRAARRPGTASAATRPSADTVTGTEGFTRQTETHTADVPPDMPGGIAGSLRDFLHALDTGATPMGECHDNIKSLAMVFGAIESAATGQRVKVEV